MAPSHVLRPCDRSSLHVSLLRLFASPAYEPPVLPAVALEIVQLSRRSDVSFDRVASVLERDPVLAARVLSLAQSALFASRSPILSLKQAMVRLGLQELRDLVLEAALHLRVFRAPGYDALMVRLSRHSTTTAHLIRALCRRTAVDCEYAFACGLLHDVGIAACILALSDDPRAGPMPPQHLEPVLRDVHMEASGVVTRLWGLSPEICNVVGTHHQLAAGLTPPPVNAALIVAEELARELDAGMSPPRGPVLEIVPPLDANPPELFRQACAALGLDGPALDAARAEAAQLSASLGARVGAA